MRTGPKMVQIRVLLGPAEHIHSLVLENGEKKDKRHNVGVVLSTYLLAYLFNFFFDWSRIIFTITLWCRKINFVRFTWLGGL